MIIAVASGKGGAGKTTISTNLAISLSKHKYDVELLDCDVEEPNCHIFVKPEFESTQNFTVPVPHVDTEKCTGCGTCATLVKNTVLADCDVDAAYLYLILAPPLLNTPAVL